MVENDIPLVYGGIIDTLGRRLYSGSITWLREYIQNAIDSGSKSIEIKLEENDLEIKDYGSGMDREILINQAFSIGKSFKGKDQIGELGIGIYAGSGICDTLSLRTKVKGKGSYVVKMNFKEYRNIIALKPEILFNEVMQSVFEIKKEEPDSMEDSFTSIRFENIDTITRSQMNMNNLVNFIEETVNVPIDDNFPHREELLDILGSAYNVIPVNVCINGDEKNVTKFNPKSFKFSENIWHKDIKDDNGKTIGKVWAVYNLSGESFEEAKILLKKKGLTVGDKSVIVSRFGAKYIPRFYGEIILLDDRIEINTSRDWFVSSEYLKIFVEKTRALLNELYSVADLDSKYGNGLGNIIKNMEKHKREAEENRNKNNEGNAEEIDRKIGNDKSKIDRKIEGIQKTKNKLEKDVNESNDPTNKLKLEIIDGALNNKDVKAYLGDRTRTPQNNAPAKPRTSPWPQIVQTVIKENFMDQNLSASLGSSKDVKDLTTRAYTFIEQKLKTMLGKKENEDPGFSKMINEFKNKYDPPDLKGENKGRYMEAFNSIMNGFYTILRNPASHTFMKDMSDRRSILEISMITDFIVRWLDQWKKKENQEDPKI